MLPMGVLSKAANGKDIFHELYKKSIIRLGKDISNWFISIENDSRNSIIYITQQKHEQYPTLISFLKDTVFDGDCINVATSIHLQKDVNSYLNNLPESAKKYINKNKTGNVVGSSFKIGTLATKANLVIQDTNISETENQEENSRKSARTSYFGNDNASTTVDNIIKVFGIKKYSRCCRTQQYSELPSRDKLERIVSVENHMGSMCGIS